MRTYKYSKWDGTQDLSRSLDENFGALAKEILEAGDVNVALGNLVRDGFQASGDSDVTEVRPVGGLNDLLAGLEEERRLRLEKYNIDSMISVISSSLDSVIESEKMDIAQELKRIEEASFNNLNYIPSTLSEKIKGLIGHDFLNDEARKKLDQILETLGDQWAFNFFRDTGGLEIQIPENYFETSKYLINDTKRLLSQSAQKKESDFTEFSSAHGHHFDNTNPQTIGELVELIRRNIVVAQTLLKSLNEESRSDLNSLLSSFSDPSTINEFNELTELINEISPLEKSVKKYDFVGSDEVDYQQGMDLMHAMIAIDDLENKIHETVKTGNIELLDTEEIENILGKNARANIEEVQRMVGALQEAGFLQKNRDRYELGPLAVRQIAQDAMAEIFSKMNKDRLGSHDSFVNGEWGDLSGATLPYESEKTFDINLQKSLFNTVIRQGASVPLKMSYQDLEVNEREHLTQAATVLMLDQSRSMGMFGTYTSAKKVALALYWLIKTKFPRDKFFVVGFSDYGMVIDDKDLPESTWNHWVAGTNMHHGLILARQLLSRQNVANKQVLMVTDGEPTAHMERGQAFFSYPPSQQTLDQTLREVKRCTREGITINTFMLEANLFLMDFIEQMSKINNGRAFYTQPDQLGRYVLVDYLNSRKAQI
ncbi:MAG: vWA domain-containing protein [Dehalococcoidia bacterium]